MHYLLVAKYFYTVVLLLLLLLSTSSTTEGCKPVTPPRLMAHHGHTHGNTDIISSTGRLVRSSSAMTLSRSCKPKASTCMTKKDSATWIASTMWLTVKLHTQLQIAQKYVHQICFHVIANAEKNKGVHILTNSVIC